MADRDQGILAEKASAALDGMEGAEDGVEQRRIIRPLLQLDELRAQPLQQIAGLGQEVLPDVVVDGGHHGP